MTWICYRGIELSARIQQILLSAEILILTLFSVVAFIKVYGSHPPSGSIKPSLDVVQPVRDEVRRPASAAILLGVFIYWGWDSGRGGQRGVREPRRGTGPRGGRLDDPARRDLPDRLRRRAVLPRHRLPAKAKQHRRPERARQAGARRGALQAADRLGADLGVGLDADDDPADRPHDAVDGALESASRRCCPASTSVT